MSSSFGKMVQVTVFGQSHSESMGVVIDGLPAGIELDIDRIQRFLERRAPGRNRFSTTRKEPDMPEIQSGLVDGKTCGAPLCAIIRNSDTRSSDYKAFSDVPRPMHADFAAWSKYGGYNDIRGGGQFSGRLTAPLCFAGAVAIQLLEKRGITIGAQVLSVGEEVGTPFDPCMKDASVLGIVPEKEFPTIDDAAAERMMRRIDAARSSGDSVGGVIECAAFGVPAGLGEPIYDSVESRLSSVLFSIPAVKGVSFGAGFDAATMSGSEHNDSFVTDGEYIKTETNRHGGILGGITTGMPVILRAAFKPTPTIGLKQRSVSLERLENTTLAAKGRHDPCIVQRAVPCVEAATAVVLLDLLIEQEAKISWK